MKQNYECASICELGVLIRAQKISPVEVVQACLKRIEELDPKPNAFITVLADQAFENFKDRVPTKDAVGVAKLKEAGAIVIGKTNMHGTLSIFQVARRVVRQRQLQAALKALTALSTPKVSLRERRRLTR